MAIALVRGGGSNLAGAARPTVEFLRRAGADVKQLHLPEFGIEGNGHGLIYELNSDAAIRPVLNWLVDHVAPDDHR
jgi:hypothetical protein